MKTHHVLYLRDGVDYRIRLDAGVALQLIAPPRAQRRIPLRKLSRVICGPQVQWDTAALLACTRAGIAITFEDRQRCPQMWCMGKLRRQHLLDTLLRAALSCHQWPQRYAHWLHDQHHHAMAGLKRQHRLRAKRLDHDHVRGLICNRLRQQHGFGVAPWMAASRSALSAWTLQKLQQRLGDPRMIMHGQPGWTLLTDLTEVLHWATLDVLTREPTENLRNQQPAHWFALRLHNNPDIWEEQLAKALITLETLLAKHYS